MINSGMMTSKTDMWETPQGLFDKLNNAFSFDVDVCALPENAKCERYFTPEQDGLSQKWQGKCWMNPPYGRQIGTWIQKAYESALGGGYSRMFIASSHRYPLVSQFLHEKLRY